MTENKNIEGLEVRCTRFGVLRQYELLPLIGRFAGPVVDAIAAGKAGDPKMVLMLSASFAEVPADRRHEISEFVRALLAGTTVRKAGEPPVSLNSEEAIQKMLGHDMFLSNLVILFVLEVNFGRFFERAGGNDPAGEKSTPESTTDQSPAPSASTRTSRKLRRPGDSSVRDG
jgi:hypothetical protein